MIRRREFITLLGGAATWPVAAKAQPRERMRRIGILTAQAESDPAIKGHLAIFAKGLRLFATICGLRSAWPMATLAGSTPTRQSWRA
jgi:hypothetical protein